MNAFCHTPTNRPALSPSPQPSPTVMWVLLLGSRLVGEGVTRGGAAGLATDLIDQPTRAWWGLGRPQARSGGHHADHQATWIDQQPPAGRPTASTALLSPAPLSRPRAAGRSSAGNRSDGQLKIMDRLTALPGDNRLSSRERHPSRPCPEGTFLDSPGFVRSTTLGCGPVQKISPEGAGLIGVLRETVGRIVTCFGGARSNATAVPSAPCVKRTPLGFRCLLDVPYPG